MSPPSGNRRKAADKVPEGDSGVGDVLTHAMEDYVKAIYKIQQQEGRATTIRVAERLQLSPASVTNMLQKLAKLKLVDYAPYQGAHLTPRGERVALEVVRHHRLLELYLAEHMGYSWDEVDAEAEKLEHAISLEFASRIDRLLGYPERDPHGDPIPTREGHLNGTDVYVSLADAAPGHDFIVRRVSDEDPVALRYLGEYGLYPGSTVHVAVTDADPSQMNVRIDGDDHALDLKYASHVFVEPVIDSTPTTA